MKRSSIHAMMIFFVLTALVSCSLFKPSPSQVVKSFYRNIESGKIEEAAKLLSSQSVQTFGSKFRAVMPNETNKIKSKGGIRSIETEESVTGEVAKVTCKVTYGDNSTEDDVLDLIKENGDWKIQMNTGK
jgi:hypothetical protein